MYYCLFTLLCQSIQTLLITWALRTQEYPFRAHIHHSVGKLSVT